MCKIFKIRYVTPSGRRTSTERKELCFRSDGINPCLYQEFSEVTELVSSSGTPSLVGDEVSTPASTSIPGTPSLTATAHYTYREPTSSSSKGKGKFGLRLNLGDRIRSGSSPTSPRRTSKRGSRSGSSNGDADSIIGIEEDGRFSPISPRFSPIGPPLSMRRPSGPPPVVSQPQPPRLRTQTPAPPSHRRNITAPDPIVRFDVDNELRDRADARETLRRENRDKARQDDEVRRRRQEADDLQFAEGMDAQEKERREQAADQFSMLEYARLQEKDRKRRERYENVVHQSDTPVAGKDIEKLERDIREMKLDEERRRKAREDKAAREEVARQEKRLREQDAKIEYQLQADLDRINRQAEASSKKQLLQVQAEIERLEMQLTKQQEKRQARERAEQLQQEIKHEDLLADEIRELESDIEREDHLRKVERLLNNRQAQAYDRQRYLPPAPMPPPLMPIMPPMPPMPTQQMVRQRETPMSPYEDAEYRRARGQQVLEDERARAATGGLQRVIAGPLAGVGRRNTVGGRERSREQVYRDLRKQYPK